MKRNVASGRIKISRGRFHLFFYLLPVVFLTVCINSGMGTIKDMPNEKVIRITNDLNGQEIEMKTNDVLQIELAEMGSAGYSWQIDKLNTEYLELVSKGTKVISEGLVGAPVIAVWLFKTKKMGNTEIILDHYRLWEGKEKATEHFSIRLSIKQNGFNKRFKTTIIPLIFPAIHG